MTYLHPNVADYGAQYSPSADDSSAFTSARNAAFAPNGIVDVPPGAFYLYGAVGGNDPKPVLWRLTGNSYGNDVNNPIVKVKDNDLVESFFNGSRYYGKHGTAWDQTAAVRIDGTFERQATPSEVAMTSTQMRSSLEVYTTVGRVNPGTFVFGSRHDLRSSAWGDGQFAALSGVASRPNDALGDGMGPRAPLWGAYAEATDQTGRPSNEGGILHGMEINVGSNDGDPHDQRVILLLSAGRAIKSGPGSTNADVGVGLSVGGAVGEVQIGTLLKPQGDFYKAGLSFAAANPVDRGAGAPPTIQLARGQYITFDVGNGYTLREIPDAIGNGMMQWRFAGAETFRLDAYGNTSQPGRAAFGYFNMQSRPAPTSSADPMGEYGDTLISGGHLYHKTSSGWYRVQMDSF
ncbi:hypothetical protein [Methylobacterium indicum]|uniref:Uncharacterized protein n=1 Tax=Methylobacterium indicum TaxID=1775910 RepID=A0A8H8X097_9HYPH|nr:hypothetical protein [Methylobacterium indicum]BCM87743.1 hypothetical protein mvi_62040 [Methylobacterium indicum]